MKTRTCSLLTVALTTALMSPLAFGQSANAADSAQETPRTTLPPPVEQTESADPRVPTPVESADPQALEEPMTSPKPPPAQARGAARAAVTQRSVWADLDTDGDGRVSAAEADVDAEFTSNFAAMDSDSDGFVTDAEFREHARVTHQGEDDQDVPPPPPSQAQGPEQAAAHSSVVQRDLWARLDSDGDGRISSVEGSVDAEFSAMFTMADADRDGFVTDAEYRAHAQAHATEPEEDTDTSDTSDAVDDRDE